jgi:hypothetical protein
MSFAEGNDFVLAAIRAAKTDFYNPVHPVKPRLRWTVQLIPFSKEDACQIRFKDFKCFPLTGSTG